MARDPNVGTWHKDEIGQGDTSSQAQRNGPQSPAVKEKPLAVKPGNVGEPPVKEIGGAAKPSSKAASPASTIPKATGKPSNLPELRS
jgi:hypothetical protein